MDEVQQMHFVLSAGQKGFKQYQLMKGVSGVTGQVSGLIGGSRWQAKFQTWPTGMTFGMDTSFSGRTRKMKADISPLWMDGRLGESGKDQRTDHWG